MSNTSWVATKTRYSFRRDKTAFRTATVFKDGKEHMRMAASEANDYCQKWNGRKGNFDLDQHGPHGYPDTGRDRKY